VVKFIFKKKTKKIYGAVVQLPTVRRISSASHVTIPHPSVFTHFQMKTTLSASILHVAAAADDANSKTFKTRDASSAYHVYPVYLPSPLSLSLSVPSLNSVGPTIPYSSFLSSGYVKLLLGK
jgi:hypothetical protein